MYCSHSQTGKTRVNIVREGLKTKKTHIQFKKNKKTGLDKLYEIQNDLFKEGLDLNEYENYLQDKINNNKYYYNFLSNDQIDNLKKRYEKLIMKENNKYSEIGEIKKMNRRQRQLFREKRKNMVESKKGEIISLLLNSMRETNGIGILKSNKDINSNNFNIMKNYLFSGGRYLETQDNDWLKYYSKLVSGNQALLFDLHSKSELYNFIYQN